MNDGSFLSYAAVQAQASATQATSAQANATGEVSISNGTTTSAEADSTSGASATGQGVRAQSNIQLYVAVSTNQTTVVFGTANEQGCCSSQASGQAVLSTAVQGPYTEGKQTRRTATTPGAVESGTDVAEVASRLPLIDPSQLAASAAQRLAPRY
ncbi:MAG: hypothetical protein JO122_15380 [Acetobacteraceae bacterium]|nr:hypothetical protein [Acetobacteraceae bacterium]